MKEFVPTKEDLKWMADRLEYLKHGQQWFTHTAQYQRIGGDTIYCVQSIDEVDPTFGDRVMVQREINKVKACVEAIGWKFKDIRKLNN